MINTKIWITQKLLTVYNDCQGEPFGGVSFCPVKMANPKGDWDDPKTWCFNNDPANSKLAAIPRGYEVESIYINESNSRVLIRALYLNEYWFTWVDAALLKRAPVRYLVRESTINRSKWEIYNTVWNQRSVGEYDNERIASQHAAKLNSSFKVGRIGAAWFSVKDGSWLIELIPTECLRLLRTKPDVNKKVEVMYRHGVSGYAGYAPFTSEENAALNNGICLTFHPHRNPYEVRMILFKIMRQRYGIEPMPPTN